MLDRVLLTHAQLRGEALVLGVGAAARDRARHRLRERIPSRPADQELRRGARERRAVGPRDEVREAGWISGAQAARNVARGDDAVAARHYLAREHDLLRLARAEPRRRGLQR